MDNVEKAHSRQLWAHTDTFARQLVSKVYSGVMREHNCAVQSRDSVKNKWDDISSSQLSTLVTTECTLQVSEHQLKHQYLLH